MTTAPAACPHGIFITGRWMHGSVVVGPVNEITGPLRSGEQAAVNATDYTGAADSIDLIGYRCT